MARYLLLNAAMPSTRKLAAWLVIGTTFGCSGATSSSGSSSNPNANTSAGAGGTATSGGSASAAAGVGGAGLAGGGGAVSAGGSAAVIAGTSAGGTGSACAGELCGACPAEVPAADAPCALPAGHSRSDCSWGDSPAYECRTLARCDATGKWSVTLPPEGCGGLAAGCPDTLTAACSAAVEVPCTFPDGSRCKCSGAGREPSCTPPVTLEAGCPDVIPNQGAPCSTPDQVCGRRPCALTAPGITVVCAEGTWLWAPITGCDAVCTSPDTPIATPTGERPIATLQVGDRVYTVDHDTVKIAPIVQVRRHPIRDHHMQRVTLASGRVLEISAPHPTADGRHFADLRAGQQLDGHLLTSVETVPFEHEATYDILPASDTGFYFAAGVLIGSTLQPARESIACGAE